MQAEYIRCNLKDLKLILTIYKLINQYEFPDPEAAAAAAAADDPPYG